MSAEAAAKAEAKAGSAEEAAAFAVCGLPSAVAFAVCVVVCSITGIEA